MAKNNHVENWRAEKAVDSYNSFDMGKYINGITRNTVGDIDPITALSIAGGLLFVGAVVSYHASQNQDNQNYDSHNNSDLPSPTVTPTSDYIQASALTPTPLPDLSRYENYAPGGKIDIDFRDYEPTNGSAMENLERHWKQIGVSDDVINELKGSVRLNAEKCREGGKCRVEILSDKFVRREYTDKKGRKIVSYTNPWLDSYPIEGTCDGNQLDDGIFSLAIKGRKDKGATLISKNDMLAEISGLEDNGSRVYKTNTATLITNPNYSRKEKSNGVVTLATNNVSKKRFDDTVGMLENGCGGGSRKSGIVVTPVVSPGPTTQPTPTGTPESTPLPTPFVTPTSTPIATPQPTPEVTPSPTVLPTVQPTPVPTLTATPVPTPAPTVAVTPSPAPIFTPEPVETPEPIETPEPTRSPEPTAPPATPEPSPTGNRGGNEGGASPAEPTPEPTNPPTPLPTPESTPVPTPSGRRGGDEAAQ